MYPIYFISCLKEGMKLIRRVGLLGVGLRIQKMTIVHPIAYFVNHAQLSSSDRAKLYVIQILTTAVEIQFR